MNIDKQRATLDSLALDYNDAVIADVNQFFNLADADPDGVGDMGQEARKAAAEQGKMLQGIFDRRYASADDFKQFVELGKEFTATNATLQANLAKFEKVYEALGGKVKETQDQIRDAAQAAVKAYMDTVGQNGGAVQNRDFADPLDVEWADDGGMGIATAKLMMKVPNFTYAFSRARQGVANTYPVDAVSPWYVMKLGDPLMDWAMVYNLNAGAFNVPQFSGVSVTKNGNAPSTPGDPDGITQTGTNYVVSAYDLETAIPLESAQNVMNVRPTAIAYLAMEYGAQIGIDSVAAIDGGVIAGNKVITGVATGLPTVANTPGKLAELVGKVKAVYRPMSCWQVNETVEALINSLYSTGGFAFVPTDQIRTVLGYPWVVNSHTEDGNAADERAAWFGNFYRGLIIAPRTEFMVEEYRQTRPGSITFFGHGACGHAAQDMNGVSYWECEA